MYQCWILTETLKVRFSLILYSFDYPGTNRIALNLFTQDNGIKNDPGFRPWVLSQGLWFGIELNQTRKRACSQINNFSLSKNKYVG